MKKGTQVIVGIIGLVLAAIAIFFLFIKDKVFKTSPTTGNVTPAISVGQSDLKALSDKVTNLETDLKNRISGISPVNNTTINGASVLTGAGNPTNSLGANKDLYFDTTNGYTFIKINGAWQYVATGIYDGGVDEYNSEVASFLRPASIGGVAQLRDLLNHVLLKQIAPQITVIDGVDYEGSQGVAVIDIPMEDLGYYGSEYVLPTYLVTNSAVMLTINLVGQQNTLLFTGQVFPNTLMIPKKVDSEWTYVFFSNTVYK